MINDCRPVDSFSVAPRGPSVGRLRMCAPTLRNAAQCSACFHGLALHGEIAKRDDADQPLASVQHRQAPHLKIPHVVKNVFQIFVIEAVLDIGTHYIPDLCVGTFALCHATNGNVAISDHPDQPIILCHRESAGIETSHHCGNFPQCLVRIGDLNVGGHAVADFHDSLPHVVRAKPLDKNNQRSSVGNVPVKGSVVKNVPERLSSFSSPMAGSSSSVVDRSLGRTRNLQCGGRFLSVKLEEPAMSGKIAAPAKRIDPKKQPVRRSDDQVAPAESDDRQDPPRDTRETPTPNPNDKGSRTGQLNKSETEDGLKARDR
ncbi:hypothetical protein RHECNPAF_6420090 [Rhizobium etli CNPAF512]|nr:hypothetical protein RHECNPAF_6420090 [Rhizobium etli CNPAF512]